MPFFKVDHSLFGLFYCFFSFFFCYWICVRPAAATLHPLTSTMVIS